MHRVLLSLVLVLGCASVTVRAQRPRPRGRVTTSKAWVTYLPPDRTFSLQFPDGVREQQFLLERDLPYLIGTMVVHETNLKQHFEIGYVDFLGAIGEPASFPQVRITEIAAELTHEGGSVLNQRAVVSGNCKGEEVSLLVPNRETKVPRVVKARAFYSAGILYVLYFAGVSDAPAETLMADKFLTSFKLAGGCHDSISVPAGSNPLVWFSGSLDPETGWHQVSSPYGARFLFPDPGSLRWVDDRPPSGVIRHYTYEYRSPEYLFNVEIFSGYKPATRATAAQRKQELDRYLAQTKAELSGGGYLVGECKPVGTGDRAGYDCPLKLTGGELTGHAEVFISPTRNFLLTAFRYHPQSDEQPVERFLSSIEIEPTYSLLAPAFSGN